MQEEQKRKVFWGYSDYGVPNWIVFALFGTQTSSAPKHRIHRRLIRMLKVMKARSPWYDGTNEYNDSVQRERVREERKELWLLQINNRLLRDRINDLEMEIALVRVRVPPGPST